MANTNVNVRNVLTTKNETQLEILWTVPKVKQKLENSKCKEIRVKVKNSQGLELVMKFLGSENDIEIQYYYPLVAKMDISFKIQNDWSTNINNNFYYQGSYSTDPRLVSMRTNVHHNYDHPFEWNTITTIKKEDCKKIITAADDDLHLKFDFIIYKTAGDEEIELVANRQFVTDLENFKKNEIFSDVVIKSADGQEFKLHKVMLASRCSVFRALFEHNNHQAKRRCVSNSKNEKKVATLLEETQSNIESPFQSEVLEEVFNFIYTNKANVEKNPQELLAAADFYQLNRLKNLCERFLLQNFSVKSILEIIVLADMHCANQLKEAAYKFIKNIRLARIIKTKEWKEFNNIQLMKDILEKVAVD